MDTGWQYTAVVLSSSSNKTVAYSNKDRRDVTFHMLSQCKASSFVISLKYTIGTVGSVGCDHHGNIQFSDIHADNVKSITLFEEKSLKLESMERKTDHV